MEMGGNFFPEFGVSPPCNYVITVQGVCSLGNHQITDIFS